jgi:diguanylate cyclase (GGDEF)-like protein
MSEERTALAPPALPPWSRAEAVYAGCLFALSATVLALALRGQGAFGGVRLADAAFFFAYGLFTISIGYHHPRLGYYSFDRVSQVASILVLGPVPAALVNGLASFVYPWHRLVKGVPLRNVVLASLNNSGLMALIVLAAGSGYELLGGPIPLVSLDVGTALLLVGLVLAMQALNDLGMVGLLLAGRRSVAGFFQWFTMGLELGSGTAAVLVALVYNTMQAETFALLLLVLSLGMLAFKRFADMRLALEEIVAERTRSLEDKTRQLELLATTDTLTGLFNRRYADEYLVEQGRLLDKTGETLTVAFADIDLFKQINDLHSHAVGDEVLKRVADTLRMCCRGRHMIARYGGEEFLICFLRTDLRGAQAVCEETRAAIESFAWRALGLDQAVTISFGLAECRAESQIRAVLITADQRLYEAKRRGRNLVVAREAGRATA